ncbi:MAG: hypothetical protein WCP70_09320 [Methanothrix sp.]
MRLGEKERAFIIVCILFIAAHIFLSPSVQAASWSGFVNTDSSSWSVVRQSQNLSAHLTEQIDGAVGPLNVTPLGRSVAGYHSRYVNVNANDVMLKERTSATKGYLKSAEQTDLLSSTQGNINKRMKVSGDKTIGIIEVNFSEEWPVLLKNKRHIYYNGSEINDRIFGGNNWDFAGTSSLYNSQYEQATAYGLFLHHLNISITAVLVNKSIDNDEIFKNSSYITSLNYLPSRITRYDSRTYSTGITDVKLAQASQNQLSTTKGLGRINYDSLIEQRYYGHFQMNMSLNETFWKPLPVNQTEYHWLGEFCARCPDQ